MNKAAIDKCTYQSIHSSVKLSYAQYHTLPAQVAYMHPNSTQVSIFSLPFHHIYMKRNEQYSHCGGHNIISSSSQSKKIKKDWSNN